MVLGSMGKDLSIFLVSSNKFWGDIQTSDSHIEFSAERETKPKFSETSVMKKTATTRKTYCKCL